MTLPHFLSLREQGKCADFNANFADMKLKALKGYNASRYVGKNTSILACKFCTQEDYSYLLAWGDEDGNVNIHNTLALHNGLSSKPKPFYSNVWNGLVCLWKDKNFEGYKHRNTVYDLAWMPGELKLVSVSGDNAAMLRDVVRQSSASDLLPGIRIFLGHTASIKAVDFSPDRHVFATGGRDGRIMTWDIRVSSDGPDHVIQDGHQVMVPHAGVPRSKRSYPAGTLSSVMCLAFQDEHTLISSGDRDCAIKVWDLRKSYSIRGRQPIATHILTDPRHGNMRYFTSLALDPHKVKLYAASNSQSIYCFNATTFEKTPLLTFDGAQVNSSYIRICLSPDGDYLLSGSSNNFGYIWNTNLKGNGIRSPLLRLAGHEDEVTCVAWSTFPDTKLVTCSDDAVSLQLWEVCLDGERDKGRHKDAEHTRLWYNDSDWDNLPEAASQDMPRPFIINRSPWRPVLRPIQLQTSPISPTFLKDLPNYLIDGTTPRHVCSPVRRPTDWLTQHRRSSRGVEMSSTSSTVSPQGSHSGPRHATKTRSPSGVQPKRSKSLLQYFKSSQKSETSKEPLPLIEKKSTPCPENGDESSTALQNQDTTSCSSQNEDDLSMSSKDEDKCSQRDENHATD